jgi:ferredoxin-thioredoxin reductase catalytic subunit
MTQQILEARDERTSAQLLRFVAITVLVLNMILMSEKEMGRAKAPCGLFSTQSPKNKQINKNINKLEGV